MSRLSTAIGKSDAFGLSVEAGKVCVTLPRCYRGAEPTDPAARLRAVQLSIGALARFARRSKAVQAGSTEVEVGRNGLASLDRFEAAFALLEDARRQGLLTIARALVSTTHPGRVDWRRTDRDVVPIMAPEGAVHSRLWRRASRRDAAHPLVALHQATVVALKGAFGLGPPETPVEPRTARATLLRTEHRLFADRHRAVHGLLRRWYGHGGEPGGLFGYTGTLVSQAFHVLWEQMLAEVLGRHRLTALAGLQGTYAVGPATQTGIRLIPDLVVRSGDRYLVLDAKAYASVVEGEAVSMPATGDLIKQIGYRVLLWMAPHGAADLDQYGNAFLFPAVSESAVRLRGVHRIPGNPVGSVVALDVNFERVATHYLAGRRDDDLLAQIEAQIFQHQEPVSGPPS